MTTRISALLFLIFVTQITFAQAPAIQWQKIYGGSNDDRAFDIHPTPDGGYIVAGDTKSTNWDVSGNNGSSAAYYPNYWIVKLNATGTLQWQKPFGGSSFDYAKSIKPTSDGGYIVAGDSFISNSRGYDCWIVKLNSSGDIEWKKALGGNGEDRANAIQCTSDGGYIVAGYSDSTNGDITGNHGQYDAWVIKLNSDGSIQWQKSLGGSQYDYGNAIQLTTDGGYIIAGSTQSNDGDVTGNHGTYTDDAWIVKLDSNGTIQWQKALGGNDSDYAKSIQCTQDGGYILAGYTYSYRGDYEGFNDTSDYWIVKIDSNGTLQWQRSIGGSYTDIANAIEPTIDGGYIVVGRSTSLDGNITGNLGKNDAWLVKLSGSGAIQWQKSLGGSQNDYGNAVHQTADGGYIIAGYSESGIGDNTNIYGGYGYWIVKLASDNLNTNETSVKSIVTIENPVKGRLNIQSKETITSLQLYTIDGKLIRNTSNKDMSVLDIPKGNYLLKIQLENGQTVSEKIIRE
ncbi:MAG: T9SS type A sorting domain-containing protein [Bergeyella sp.]